MERKTIALVVILLILAGFTAYIVYSEFKPAKINPAAEIKNYVALYFLSSRVMFPLASNLNTNLTRKNG